MTEVMHYCRSSYSLSFSVFYISVLRIVVLKINMTVQKLVKIHSPIRSLYRSLEYHEIQNNFENIEKKNTFETKHLQSIAEIIVVTPTFPLSRISHYQHFSNFCLSIFFLHT